MKVKQPNKSEQRTAADILNALLCCTNMDEVWEVYTRVYEKYGLCDDPFTGFPVTADECAKNSEEYENQLFEDRYGYPKGM